eukprot:271226_1
MSLFRSFKEITTDQKNSVRNLISKKLQQIKKIRTDKSVSTKTNTECKFNHQYDLSWTVGTLVLVQNTQGVIQSIVYKKSRSRQPSIDDKIIVRLSNETTNKEYVRTQLKSHPIHIKNRNKLTKYCTAETYSSTLNQWISCYIDDYGYQMNNPQKATNGQWLAVNGQNYNRWSNKIKCCASLLNLVPTSVIFIFDAATSQWFYGKIMYTKEAENENNVNPLSIFEVHYIKNNTIYIKYIHQFSSSIALFDSDAIYPELQCSVYDEKKVKKAAKQIDATDWTYYQLLIQGYVGTDVYVNHDILSIIIKYIGFCYNLVMHIESITWSSAVKNKNMNLTTRKLPFKQHNELRCLTLAHPLELKIRDILIQRGEYSDDKFRAAKNLLQSRLLKDNLNIYNSNVEMDETVENIINHTNMNDSLVSLSGLSLQSDW